MRKWIFKLLKIAGITLVSLSLLISILLYFFKDDLINYAVGEMNKHLKSKVFVAKIDVSFWSSFPSVGVNFNQVFIPDSYEKATLKDTFFYSDRVRLKFNLWSVWNKEYKVKSINIEAGKLYIKHDLKGRANYDIVKEDTSAINANQDFALSLDLVELENMRFAYLDDQTNQFYTNHFDKLELNGAFSRDNFSMIASSNSYLIRAKRGDVTLLKNVPLSFKLSLNVDKVKKTISFLNSSVIIGKTPLAFSGVVDSAKIDFQLKGINLAFGDVVKHVMIKEIQDSKDFEVNGRFDFQLAIKGKNSKPAISCSLAVRDGSMIEPSTKIRSSDIQLALNYSSKGSASTDVLDVKYIHMKTLKGEFDAKFNVKSFEAPRIQGSAKGSIDLAMVHRIFPITHVQTLYGAAFVDANADIRMNAEKGMEINDGSVSMKLENVALQQINDTRKLENLNGTISFKGNEAVFKALNVRVNSTDLELNGTVKNLIGYAKKVQNLEVDLIAASRLIKVTDLQNNAEEKSGVDESAQTWSFPEDIRGAIGISVENIDFDGHSFQSIQADLVLGQRALDFQNLQVRNAGATIAGRLQVNETRIGRYLLTSDLHTSTIDFKRLFTEWKNFDQSVIQAENIAGNMEVDLKLEAPIDLKAGVLKHLVKADVAVKIKNGRLQKVKMFKDIVKSLRESKAKLVLGSKNISFLENKLEDIQFQTLENKFTIRDGVLQFPKMEINSSALNISVAGVHSFANEIDYRFNFRFRDLKQKEASEFGDVVDDGTGSIIYMRMSGTLENPIIAWDQEAKKEQATQNREDAMTDAKSIFKSEFGIGKGDSTIKTYVPKKLVREEIRLEFDEKKVPSETPQEKENRILKKIKAKTDKWKKQQTTETEFEL